MSNGPQVRGAQVHECEWGEAALCGVGGPRQAPPALCARLAAVLVCLETPDPALSEGENFRRNYSFLIHSLDFWIERCH